MDIISHGLWGGLVLGRKNKLNFWLAFLIGLAPDLFSFGLLTLLSWLGIADRIDWSTRIPSTSAIPGYINTLYNITHSFVVFLVVFGLIWLIRKKPIWLLLAWPLHIVVDIFTHSLEFYPTPFLWPVFNYYFDGIVWASPYIFFSNWGLLLVLYIYFGISKFRNRRK